jgi:hypothetical protein
MPASICDFELYVIITIIITIIIITIILIIVITIITIPIIIITIITIIIIITIIGQLEEDVTNIADSSMKRLKQPFFSRLYNSINIFPVWASKNVKGKTFCVYSLHIYI